MSLYSFSGSIRGRLDSRTYTCGFKPRRNGVRPSDLDLVLEQDGWWSILEGKIIAPSAVKRIDSFAAVKKMQQQEMPAGQRYLLDSGARNGMLVGIGYSASFLRKGYEVGQKPCEEDKSLTYQFVKGPTGGEYYGHPYIHVPLLIHVICPNRKIKDTCLSATEEQINENDWAENVKIMQNMSGKEFAIKFPAPSLNGDDAIEDYVDNDKYASIFFNLNTYLSKKHGKFSPHKMFKND